MKNTNLILCLSISLLLALPLSVMGNPRSGNTFLQKHLNKNNVLQKNLTNDMPIAKIFAIKNPNAKAGEGATIDLHIEAFQNAFQNTNSLMSVLFFSSDYIAPGAKLSAVVDAFKQGDAALEKVYNDAIYRFPANGGFEDGYNSLDTSFTVTPGKYDILNTDYDLNWVDEGCMAAVCPLGYVEDYQFEDGYRYLIYLYTGASIDDYMLYEIPPYAASTTEVIAPQSSKNLGASETVKVNILNTGFRNHENTTVYLKINDRPALTQTWIGNVKYDSSYSVTFAADLSEKGTYDIKAWTVVEGNGSDTAYTGVLNTPDSITVPWRDDFDWYHLWWSIINVDAHLDENFGIWIMDRTPPGRDANNVSAKYKYSDDIPGNDYLVTASPFALKAGVNYNIAASLMVSVLELANRIEIYIGTSPDPESMEYVNGITLRRDDAFTEIGYNFTVDKDSNYYMAIKAASEKKRAFIYVDYVKVDTGIYISHHDFGAVGAEWRETYNSCELPEIGKATVMFQNKGNKTTDSFSFSYKINSGAWKTSDFKTPLGQFVDIGQYVAIYLDTLRFTDVNADTLTVAFSSITPEDDTLRIIVYSTADTMLKAPLISHFAKEASIKNWEGQGSWNWVERRTESGQNIPNSGEYGYGEMEPGIGLMSKCITLEKGKTYKFDMAYWGQSFPDYNMYTSFDVRIGKANTPIDSFRTLASFNNCFTNKTTVGNAPDDYDTAVFAFSVDKTDDYVISMYPTRFDFDMNLAYGGPGVSALLCFRYINITDSLANSITEPVDAANTLRVYPVPATDILTVTGATTGKINVMDITGKIVLQRDVAGLGGGRMQINVSGLPTGVYILRNGNQTAKFIKK